MSTDGYNQAIANYVYEIDRIAIEMEDMPGQYAAKILSLQSRDQIFKVFEERFRNLDMIITVIAETYHRTEDEVEADITDFMTKQITKTIEETLTNGKNNNS